MIVRCQDLEEAAERALQISISRDYSFTNQLGRKVEVRTIGIDSVFNPYDYRAISGLEIFSRVYTDEDMLGPPPEWLSGE